MPSLTQPPLIYVCSRFRATDHYPLAGNIAYAKACSRLIFEEGGIPITPHLLYPSYLNDHSPFERELGLSACLRLIDACSEFHIFLDRDISEGMERELAYVANTAITVKRRHVADILHTPFPTAATPAHKNMPLP